MRTPLRHHRLALRHLLRIALLATFAFASVGLTTGCRNKKDDKQVKEKTIKSKTKKKDPIEMDGPSPEELAKSPCGNPDWAKLPPGMDAEKAKKKKEEESAADEEKTSEENPAPSSE